MLSNQNTNHERVCGEQVLFDCSNEIESYNCKTCPDFRTNHLTSLRAHFTDGHGNENSRESVYNCAKSSVVTIPKYLILRHRPPVNSFIIRNNQTQFNLILKYEPITSLNETRLNNQPKSGDCSIKLNFQPNWRRTSELSRCSSPGNPSDKCEVKRNIHWSSCEHKSEVNDRVKTQVSNYPENIRWFKCEHCPYKSTAENKLKKHTLSSHTGQESGQWYECAQCSSKFKRKGNLKAHILNSHTSLELISWFVCEHCPYKSKSNGNLKKHHLSCHANPEEICWARCEQCSYKCKRKGNLKSHVLFCHTQSEGVQWFRCEYCPHKFKKKSSLKEHILARHTKPENIHWFECEHCPSKFKQQRNFKRHILVHSKPEETPR